MFYNNTPTIKNYDLVVVGNSLAAVVSAGKAAKSGKSVALVTQSELLFGEFSEGLLGFLKENSPIFEILTDMGIKPADVGKEYHIPCGMAAKAALKYLKNAGVNLFLKAAPIGLLKNENIVCGIAVATKFGAFALKGNFVADFSDRTFYKYEKAYNEYLYAVQLGGVDLKEIRAPHKIKTNLTDICDVTLHRDCRSEDTCVITFKTQEKYASLAVEKGIGLVKYLIKNHNEFVHSGVLKYSLRPISTEVSFDTPQKNLLRFKSGSILNDEDYFNALLFATDLIATFLEKSDFKEPDRFETTYGSFDLRELYNGTELDEFLGAELLGIKIPDENAPTVSTELFIAGLGAGGAAAMKAALESGAKVVGAEALPLPAGTRGQGMVSAFWHGYQGGFAVQNLAEVKKFSKENLGEKVPTYVAETAYDTSFCKAATVFYESIVFAALKQGENTVGGLLATPDGIVKVSAVKTVDATGDGDLAALSGVRYMPNGDPRDKVTQGYSVWGEEKVGTPFKDSLYKSDEDSISTEKYSEFLRGIFTAHLKQSDAGFSALLTVRESRRIKGKYTLNMKDILKEKTFDDTVTVSLCKYDAHGMGTSDAYHTMIFKALRGKEIPDVRTRIPLRALLPEGDEGLMVISKAISATRDAGCLIRMNPDIQNTGYAAGVIAANAAKNGIDYEAAYTPEIKNDLINKQILPDYYNLSPEYTAEELIAKIKSGDIWARAVATVCPEMVADFEAAYDGDKNLGLVLAALGSKLPFENMLIELKDLIKEYKKSGDAISTDNATLIEKSKALKALPDKIKSHAVLLSRLAAEDNTKKAELLPILREALEAMEAGGGYGNPENGIYQNSKVSNRIVPNFKAIFGLVAASEMVADKCLTEVLIGLSKKKNIRLSDGDEIHSVQLYLRIMAAAARCGSEVAADELKKYLDSERLFFRQFVKGELDALSSAETDVLPVTAVEFWL